MQKKLTPLALAPALLVSVDARAQVQLVDFLPGAFVDIAATGQRLSLADDAEVDVVSALGNSLFPAGTYRVGANGGLRVGSTGGSGVTQNLSPNNAPLPSLGAFQGARALLPFWDDLDPGVGTTGSIYVDEVAGMFIVQWDEVRVAAGTFNDRVTFQIQIPSSGKVLARFVYRTLPNSAAGGLAATIGYQDGSIQPAPTWSHELPHSVRPGTVLSLVDLDGSVLVVPGIEGEFIDATLGGTALNIPNVSEFDLANMPINSLFTSGVARVGTCGAVRVGGTGTELFSTNRPIPSVDAFSSSSTLLPFWDHIQTFGGTLGDVWRRDLDDRVVLQWDDVGFDSGGASRATFQVQIFERGPVVAQFVYRDIEGARAARGASATIGYQSGSPGASVTFGFDTPCVEDGDVLSVVHLSPDALAVGREYCTAPFTNLFAHARLSSRGSASIVTDDLRLEARPLPLGSAAYFLVSRDAGLLANPGGSLGDLCLTGAIGRVVGGSVLNSGATGAVRTLARLGQLPSPTGTFAALPGDTLHFQCWFRTPSAGVVPTSSSLSSGLQVTVVP